MILVELRQNIRVKKGFCPVRPVDSHMRRCHLRLGGIPLIPTVCFSSS
ncbi:MAG: hypothetical protein OJF51_000988 [Nitrospira sp.]|nr:MAG: hypothetical protein OJF51_000988 [Nitrospira sp.]